VAPRLLALTGLTDGARPSQRALRAGAFVAGLCCSYVALGLTAGALGWIAGHSRFLYACAACASLVVGAGILLRGTVTPHACEPHARRRPVPSGVAALAGMGFASIGSPCCGPVALVLFAMPAAAGDRTLATLLLTAFAVGHVLPLLVFASGWLAAARFVERTISPAALATVSGTLALALGAYYACLA
ncbi:MAG TPA: cytochrome c biogenesis protein CcdA, partial [Candidatus Acidoferrales bacterium]|nr:cytochrome c biogenesis protein CcdA [Candidatus Acidoferrales bacterium]